jgi:hypothetical protein
VSEGAGEFLAVQRALNRQRDSQIDENRDGLAFGQQKHHSAMIGHANLYIGDRDWIGGIREATVRLHLRMK